MRIKPEKSLAELAIEEAARNQVALLREKYKMTASDIVSLYSGAHGYIANDRHAERAIIEHFIKFMAQKIMAKKLIMAQRLHKSS